MFPSISRVHENATDGQSEHEVTSATAVDPRTKPEREISELAGTHILSPLLMDKRVLKHQAWGRKCTGMGIIHFFHFYSEIRSVIYGFYIILTGKRQKKTKKNVLNLKSG